MLRIVTTTRDAPTRSSSESATWIAISARPHRVDDRVVDSVRASALSAPTASVLAVRSAGTIPARTAEPMAIVAVKSRIRGSGATSSSSGVPPCEASRTIRGETHDASPSPRAPPIRPRIAVSVSSCRINRLALAPTALRSAISRCRLTPRASSRLTTFAQAMRRTRPTAPMRSRTIVENWRRA